MEYPELMNRREFLKPIGAGVLVSSLLVHENVPIQLPFLRTTKMIGPENFANSKNELIENVQKWLDLKKLTEINDKFQSKGWILYHSVTTELVNNKYEIINTYLFKSDEEYAAWSSCVLESQTINFTRLFESGFQIQVMAGSQIVYSPPHLSYIWRRRVNKILRA